MKKFALGFFVGIAFTALTLALIFRNELHSKFEFGLKNGIIEGHRDAAHALEKEFGQYDGHSPYKVLYSVKTTDVISIETNGIKTVRVIP
jgi:hypothetical protein